MLDRREALAEWLAARTGASAAHVEALYQLSGGAIQENWALDVTFEGGSEPGAQVFVLRADAPSGVAVSLGRPQEFALFNAAFSAGVTVPEPLWQDPDGSVIGKPFFVMRRVHGTAAGHQLVKEVGGSGCPALAASLGRELARIHTILPPREDLDFLGEPPADPAKQAVAAYRGWLDRQGTPHPVLEWGLRWLERHAPTPSAIVLCHNDYRTGNYMVDGDTVTGILDWEFAGWGDSMSDIGWFCAPCWRFGAREREAGGIGPQEDFCRGYEEQSGRRIDRDAIHYWEVMATVRWAIIALQQAERHFSGGETNLELALTADVVPELELDILDMTMERM